MAVFSLSFIVFFRAVFIVVFIVLGSDTLFMALLAVLVAYLPAGLRLQEVAVLVTYLLVERVFVMTSRSWAATHQHSL